MKEKLQFQGKLILNWIFKQTYAYLGKNCIMRSFQILLFFVIVISIIRCSVSPQLIYRLQPESDSTVWLWGKQYQQTTKSNFEIFIAFSEQYENYLVFDFSIANSSDIPVLIKPEDFYYIPKTYNEKIENIMVLDTTWAVDPEKKLLKIDKDKSIEDADFAEANATDLLGSVLKMSYDIATIGKEKTNEEIEKKALEDQRDELNSLNQEITHNNSIKNLNNKRNLWSNKAIRKTTLFPKYSIHGYIFFPANKRANGLSIEIPVENIIFTADFNQEKHKPGRYQK